MRLPALLVALVLTLTGCAKPSPTANSEKGSVEIGNEKLDLVPSSESKARAEAALPSKPSEDVSSLLRPYAPRSPKAENQHSGDYSPEDEAVTWVVTAHFAGNPRLNESKLERALDEGWRRRSGCLTRYGYDPDRHRWSFVTPGGAESFTMVRLEWDLLPFDKPPPRLDVFESRTADVAHRLAGFGKPTLTFNVPPVAAARRAQQLAALKQKYDQEVTLRLAAPTGKSFDGKDIWDVMGCLGLEWGDMDCFHWNNPSDRGDDHFFSVSTSTDPGYFFPEEIAAGKVHVEDLVFSFSLPRSAEPGGVFDGMDVAVEYCRKRLGGTITDEHGNPANLPALRSHIAEVDGGLRKAGFQPGANATLRLF